MNFNSPSQYEKVGADLIDCAFLRCTQLIVNKYVWLLLKN